MDNVLDKKNRLLKQKRIINLLLFPCWVLSFYISISALGNVYPIMSLGNLCLVSPRLHPMSQLLFADFVMHSFTGRNHSPEYDYMLSPVSPLNELLKFTGGGRGDAQHRK